MQQIVPFHQSAVDIHFSANQVVMTTKNVARLCLKESAVSPVNWRQRSVHIDGTQVTVEEGQGKLSYIRVHYMACCFKVHRPNTTPKIFCA